MASANGHLEVIKLLLERKKDGKPVLNLNARNSDGCTALRIVILPVLIL